MRVVRRVLALLAALVLVLAVAAPAAATRGQPEHAVPFHMQISGTDRPLDMAPGMPPFLTRSTFNGRCSIASDWVTTIDSTGTAAHLGSVSVLQSHCTRFDFFAASPQPAVFGDGRMVITAANGDELHLAYSGSFDFYPTSDPAIGTSVITYGSLTIVGGTGMFDGASGTLDGSAVDHFPLGSHDAVFSGSIVYDASARAGG